MTIFDWRALNSFDLGSHWTQSPSTKVLQTCHGRYRQSNGCFLRLTWSYMHLLIYFSTAPAKGCKVGTVNSSFAWPKPPMDLIRPKAWPQPARWNKFAYSQISFLLDISARFLRVSVPGEHGAVAGYWLSADFGQPTSWFCTPSGLKVEGLRLSSAHLDPARISPLQTPLPRSWFRKSHQRSTWWDLPLAKFSRNNGCLVSLCFATHLQPPGSWSSLKQARLVLVGQGASATNARAVWDPKISVGLLIFIQFVILSQIHSLFVWRRSHRNNVKTGPRTSGSCW